MCKPASFFLYELLFSVFTCSQLAELKKKKKWFLPALAPDMHKSLYTYLTHSSVVLQRNLLSSWSLKKRRSKNYDCSQFTETSIFVVHDSN